MKKKQILSIAILFSACGMALAQQPHGQHRVPFANPAAQPGAPAVADQPPQYEATEHIAIQKILDDLAAAAKMNQEAQQHLQEIGFDVRRNHPGYEMNVKTLALQPVAPPPPPTGPPPPAKTQPPTPAAVTTTPLAQPAKP